MIRRTFCIGLVLSTQPITLVGRLVGQLLGQETGAGNQALVPMPTLGGKQFWADELFFHQWRIQHNVLTGHYRLLDENNRRHASGTYRECRDVLEQIKRQRRLPPMRGKAVVVLHGLIRSRSSMNSLCRYLRKKAGCQVFNVEYPSTRYDIAEHARALRHIVDHLDGIEEISFIGHSMGNVVIRHYLGDLAGHPPRTRPRFCRFVMLAPPNQGSHLAAVFANNVLFKEIVGDAGQELGHQWPELERRLATPDFEFGIIAGGKNNAKGYNPLLAGDNDGTISTETTKLTGAQDFVVVPVLHSFIMDNARVQQYVLRFLQRGYFTTAEQRHPLERQP